LARLLLFNHFIQIRNASHQMKRILDSRQLLAFAAVARRGSFTLAAKDLFLTQSAVSHAMKALEEEIGSRLLDRVGKRVLLTQAGEQFLRHTEKILAEMDTARAELDTLANWGHGRLRVGASTTACQYLLPTVLREFKQSFPRCVITIKPGDHKEQLELLRTNQIDLAIMIEPSGDDEFHFVPLFSDELRILVAPLHPWARAGAVDAAGLGEETLILYNKNSYTFRMISDYFRAERVNLSNVMELGSMEAIKELVKIGLGAGVIAPWIAQRELKSGALVSFPLGKKALKRNWGVVCLKGRRLPLAEETFVGLCQSVTEELRLSGSAADS
jgi:LysR family transcriptional regulator, low CO2-responsive transcriptional regulator